MARQNALFRIGILFVKKKPFSYATMFLFGNISITFSIQLKFNFLVEYNFIPGFLDMLYFGIIKVFFEKCKNKTNF